MTFECTWGDVPNDTISPPSRQEMATHPRMIGHASKIADLFLARFHPDRPLAQDDPEFQTRMEDIRAAIESDVEDSTVSDVLYKMMDIVTHTLKTNVYMQDRYALSLRLDPIIMGENYQPHLPYGVLFVHGRRFNGYHVRFRDISRGGLRLVAPANSEQLALESARQYDECYGLAFAQQLKNKDIPEGGSKAVCLIDANDMVHGTRDFVMRKSVKAFTDSILDLVVQTDETRSNIVDYYGKPEVLYLGPDENVIPDGYQLDYSTSRSSWIRHASSVHEQQASRWDQSQGIWGHQ
jgi:glutamate dehydrogenase